ncbi:acyl carrier protein [Streptomyces hundungensis]|uniref:acyl carrier protein n=1 Tax=Streptomyces hundungensis TaxID=1077946 RepID=UPI0034110928
MTDSHSVLFTDLRAILVEELRFPAAQITPTAPVHDLEFDSLARMELSVALEHRLGICVLPETLHAVETLHDIITLVQVAMTPSAPPAGDPE